MRLTTRLALALFMAAFLAAGLMAAPQAKAEETPDWFYSDIVDVGFVKDHVIIPRDKEKVMIIDSRPYKTKFVGGHIPGAYSIPDTTFDDHVSELPKNKDSLLIFYCGGFT